MATKQNQQDSRINEVDRNVQKRFDVRKRLGKGAYGIVWKAFDRRKKDSPVALKKIFDAFRDDTDAQRTYREVMFLRIFRHHPNVIRLLNVQKASNNLDFYLVFDFMESDLHNVIKKGDMLKDIHKRFIMYQLTSAIKYMHSGNVIHRDLKPSNILIDSKCRLKVADFGLARTLSATQGKNIPLCLDYKDEDDDVLLTDYVATRWYRAPELLVSSRRYTKGVDMWSIGCILGEMLRQKPLFQGTSTGNQIERIVNALPTITKNDIDAVGSNFATILHSKKITRDRNYSLNEILCGNCAEAIDLVKSLLVLNPERRLTAKQTLLHPFVNRFRATSADMEMHSTVHTPLSDDVRYTVEQYRSALYNMNNRETHISNDESEPTPRIKILPRTRTKPRTIKKVNPAVNTLLTVAATKNTFGVNTLRQNYTQAWSEQHFGVQKQQSKKLQPVERGKENNILLSTKTPITTPTSSLATIAELKPCSVQLERELAAVAATAISSNSSLWRKPQMLPPKNFISSKSIKLNQNLSYCNPRSRTTNEIVASVVSSYKGTKKTCGDVILNTGDRKLLCSNSFMHLTHKYAHNCKKHISRKENITHKDEIVQPALVNVSSDSDLLDNSGEKSLQTQFNTPNHIDNAIERLELHRQRLLEEYRLNAAFTTNLPLTHIIANLTDPTKEGQPDPKLLYSPKLDSAERREELYKNICYLSRVHNLELEVEKCKQQLSNYIRDQEEQKNAVASIPSVLGSPQNDSGIYMSESSGSSDGTYPKRTPYFHALNKKNQFQKFKLEQNVQKRLQLKEFLTRDDENAFELPTYQHGIYKAKTGLPFPLFIRSVCSDNILSSESAENVQYLEYCRQNHSRKQKINEVRHQDMILPIQRKTTSQYRHQGMRPEDIEQVDFSKIRFEMSVNGTNLEPL